MKISKLIFLLWLIFPGLALAQMGDERGFEFFDHIYTINLPHSIERRLHVIAEFKRLNIANYEIFVATSKDSDAVKQFMRSGFVRKYPPCFRCNKFFCRCTNNMLIAPQIGNWISFINVFKDIVKNNYEFVLITEDDVKFADNARLILNTLINRTNLARNNIDLNKPLLIRFEQRGSDVEDLNDIKFTRKIVMSNACFMVNKLYAQAFLNNLHCIDRTSDMYIQEQILFLDRTIQHLTASPAPAYQLSDHPQATLYSEIHPKGIDATDKARAKEHTKRITYWNYLLSLCERVVVK